MLQAADTHGGDVIHTHGFLHYKRFAVLDADQVAVEAGDGREPFPDFMLLRKKVRSLRLLSVLGVIGEQSSHTALELSGNIHYERGRDVGVERRIEDLGRSMRLGL